MNSNNKHPNLKRTFLISRVEIYFIITFVMLGIVMYWTALVVDQQSEIAIKQNEFTIEQNREIIENQDNNTALLVELFERQNKLLANQIMLVSKVANATQTLHQSSNDINQHVNTIIEESNTIGEMIAYFRENFGERFIVNETAVDRSTVDRILRNVTEFEQEIVLLREELGELTELLTNRTGTVLNFILPAAMASEDEDEDEDEDEEQEDIVGEILAEEGVPRNPPEANSPEVASGQISSFSGGPKVVYPDKGNQTTTNSTG